MNQKDVRSHEGEHNERNLDPNRYPANELAFIEKNWKTGAPQVAPDMSNGCFFIHPIPEVFHKKVQVGEQWKGWFGNLYDTNKRDKRGNKLFVRYFIPVEKMSEKMSEDD
jgi:hypothetical protein